VTTQPTPQHQAHSRRSRSVRARRVRLGACSALSSLILLFAIGCGGGGGSGSETAAAAIAVAPVDLPPGQTTAQMAWAPSEGQVDSYVVFQSLGERGFQFLDHVGAPEIEITGAPGDSIRILVIALGVAGSQSEASHPSPPLRFHAAVESAAAVAAIPAVSSPSGSPSTVEAVAQRSESDATDEAFADADSTNTDGSDDDEVAAAEANSEDSEDEVVLIDQALREQLLRSDARFPFGGISQDASQWIQTFVDAQVGAGVSLAGSGEQGGDALRELIWTDASGQLFVSDGASIVTTENLPSTFVEAIRLRLTERFVGLADFDGDGVGDWIVEDTVTGDVWILNDENEGIPVISTDPELRLVAHGDFDGNGRNELLWQHTDLSFRIGQPNDAPVTIEWILAEEGSGEAIHSTSSLLSVADLNGDGRDDLLLRGLDGFLELALSLPDSSGLRFERQQGPESTTDGLELIATLDVDHDGAAEIAWWGDLGLEIWDAQNGL